MPVTALPLFLLESSRRVAEAHCRRKKVPGLSLVHIHHTPSVSFALGPVGSRTVPCGSDNCHCSLPDMEDDETAHLYSRTSRKVILEAQKELDQRLQDVGVTPSQRHGMRVPSPRTSAWQDRPPTPENVQRKRTQLEQPLNEPGLSKPVTNTDNHSGCHMLMS